MTDERRKLARELLDRMNPDQDGLLWQVVDMADARVAWRVSGPGLLREALDELDRRDREDEEISTEAPSISGPEPTYEQAMRRRDELLVTLPGMNGVVDIGAGMDPEKE